MVPTDLPAPQIPVILGLRVFTAGDFFPSIFSFPLPFSRQAGKEKFPSRQPQKNLPPPNQDETDLHNMDWQIQLPFYTGSQAFLPSFLSRVLPGSRDMASAAPIPVRSAPLPSCLSIQMCIRDSLTPVMKTLTWQCLEMIAKNQIPAIARKLRLSPAEAADCCQIKMCIRDRHKACRLPGSGQKQR